VEESGKYGIHGVASSEAVHERHREWSDAVNEKTAKRKSLDAVLYV